MKNNTGKNTCKTDYFEMFLQLTRRHLLVFFRNKVRIFFTLMVPVIIFVIYILFLRDLELDSAESILRDASLSLSEDTALAKHVSTLIDSWMLSGIIAISTITVSFQTNTIIISDKENGINRDFASSPVSRNVLISSYFVFNVLVTVIVCLVFLLVCLIYLACLGEFAINFADFLLIVCMLVFSSVSSVLLTVFVSSFINRDSTMASINTVFSTAAGFLIGAYMPLSTMGWAQNVCAFFPGTYACSLLRYAFMSTPAEGLSAYISSLQLAGDSSIISELTDSFGYNISFFGISVAPAMQAVALLVFTAVLVAANVFIGKNLITVRGVTSKKRRKIKVEKEGEGTASSGK